MAGWIEALEGLDLDMPLSPQPEFELHAFFPQLLNGLEVPSMLAREPVVAVGIAKALTPRGRVSRRALPLRYGPHDLRAQWGLAEGTRLLCIGNYLDPYLERLWTAQSQENVWGRLQALGLDAATSLNFSIYLDRPRLEHLVNVKRSWLTVQRMQETSSLLPTPHLQWAALPDLERRVGGILEGLGRRLEREHRARSRRTRHAERRHASGSRPTPKAIDDARVVDEESLMVDERSGTLVVLGQRGRTHYFTGEGQHVSSVRYSREAIARKLKQEQWSEASPEQIETFRRLIEAQEP